MDAVSGAFLGGALVAFITGGFNYLDKRKTAPELQESKMLDFWLQQVSKVEEKQTIELNGIRKSFDEEKLVLSEKYHADIIQLRQEAQAHNTANEILVASLNAEIRQIITQRGNDQLTFQTQIGNLRADFHVNNLQIEKEKTEFLVGIFSRFETMCSNLGVKLDDTNKPNSDSIKSKSILVVEPSTG